MPDKLYEPDNRSSTEKNEMSTFKRVVCGTWRTAFLVAAAGTLLESSCSTAEVKAILTGIEVATNQLNQAENDNISFGDWLASELDN